MSLKTALNGINISKKITLLFVFIMAVSTFISAYTTILEIQHHTLEAVQDNQDKNIKFAASILKRDNEEFDVEYNSDGSIKRFVLSDIPEFKDHKIIDEIGSATGETSTVFIWDEKTEDYWRRTTNIIKNDGSRAVGTPLGKKGVVYPYMQKGEIYVGEANILGKPYFTRYDPIYFKDSDKVAGILYVGLEKTKFDSYISGLVNTYVMIASVIILCSIVVFLVVFKQIFVKQVNKIISQMQRLSSGDKDFEIEGADRGDEIGEMGKALQIFKENALQVEHLQEEQQQAQAKNAEARRQATLEMASQFEERVGGVVKTVEQAASDIQTMASALSAAVQQTTEQSGSVASASQEASLNVQTVASAAEQMATSIREISRNVTDTADTARNSAESAKVSQEKLQHLRQAVDEIDSVIQSINDVAEQTNLLALNATIEAARAGDAGKGFAVVASEVKSLANETHKMTEEISKKVEDIKGSARETISSVNDIINQITAVDDKTTNVAAAIEEQNSATEEISRNVQEASTGTNEVSRSIEEVQKAASESAGSTEQLKGAANDLADQAYNLKDAVETFLKEVRAS